MPPPSPAERPDGPTGHPVGDVTVHYWASARAAAGTSVDVLPADAALTLAEVTRAVLALHPDRPGLAAVLDVCSALVGDRPVGGAAHETIVVEPGQTVEFLPPFAGG